jgi:hypothetical protein
MQVTELDDLKATWQTLNRNLERQHKLALHQFREIKHNRLRAGFRPLVAGQIIQIICGAFLSLIAGNFWVNHIGVLHLMVYGISVHAYGLMLILFAARDLYLIKRLDYANAVLTLQKQLADLRAWHMQAGLWFGFAGCFVWIPLMLMIFRGLGADVWVHNPDVVGWLLLSGAICLGIMTGIILWSRRPSKEKFARGLANSSAGRAVKRAEALLAEIESFERE